MEKPPKQPDAPQTPEEQELQQTIMGLQQIKPGVNFLRGIPFVYELLPGNEGEKANENNPANGEIVCVYDPTAHESRRWVFHVRVWEGVPVKYRPILVAHELREHDKSYSHEEAVKYEMGIACRILSDEELVEFKEWRKRYEGKNLNKIT